MIGTIFLLLAGTSHFSAFDVSGAWYTPDRKAIVTIEDCGDGTPCGVITWVEPEGGITHDVNNPEDALRGRSMHGVKLLANFERGAEEWRQGEIYNPKNGRTYRARLERISDDTIAVSGCLGPVCKKLLWERAESGTERDAIRSAGAGEETSAL
jgi:uncharacterized protein (DUF2147 family)